MAKIPGSIKTYCPKCKAHTDHTVKEAKKGKRRTLSWGQQKHLRKIMGYTSKVGKNLKPVKQSKKAKLLLKCVKCGKAHERIMPHAKKRIEVKKKE